MTSEKSFEMSEPGRKMPALFIGHGTPMNTLEDNTFSRNWQELGQNLPRPRAILCVSAHWETRGSYVTAMSDPQTIHDFGGFPRALFEYQYPAPGSPELARLVQETVASTPVKADQSWGLDHGTWSVLARMYPQADIPVVQLSLDRSKDPAFHYALGKELHKLREQGILILGSGNIVHNLRTIVFQEGWEEKGLDWAIEFDEAIKKVILSGDHTDAIHYEKFGRAAQLAVNSAEHYLPLLYILGLQDEQDRVTFYTEKCAFGSLSMRSVQIG
ncbi:MAG TPA: 4,5-DOPA dioxygenase extradiol [Chloroflexia bacterium]|nr:4,5-DOPA dioxygenase extradiol [Chloroflexia bacterium]